LTDIFRTTWAHAGFVEVLPLILVKNLCSGCTCVC
jgi:hypothetical protein